MRRREYSSCVSPDEHIDRNEARRRVPDRSGNLVLQPAVSKLGDLCLILPKVQALFQKSGAIFDPKSIHYESILRQHRDEATALSFELLVWFSTQPEMIRPKTIERFTQPYILRFPELEDLVCPITRADIYDNCELMCMNHRF